MKFIILVTIFGTSLYSTNLLVDNKVEFAQIYNIQEQQEVISPFKVNHDWECKYIIEDHYHGFIEEHYVDSFDKLVDGSIQFVGNDGTVYHIPANYYTVIENK